MAETKSNSGVQFDELTKDQQEAYIPRGEFKNPQMLDHGNAPEGAPSGPQPYKDDKPDAGADDETAAAPKPSAVKKRTA